MTAALETLVATAYEEPGERAVAVLSAAPETAGGILLMAVAGSVLAADDS